jgi:hypothetical protein
MSGFCQDCGVSPGTRYRVFTRRAGWHTLRLCAGCADQWIADGHQVEPYEDWAERKAEYLADQELGER